jgi:glucose dehydrogenase
MNQWIVRCASVPAVGMVLRVACVALMVAACGTESALDYGKDTTQEIPGDDRLHPEVKRDGSYKGQRDAPRGTQKEQRWSLKKPETLPESVRSSV